jgi:2-methylcitrate dehydratase PrpD
MTDRQTAETTRLLAEFIARATPVQMPERLRAEAVRASLNFIGCALGGARHPAVTRTMAVAERFSGAERVSVIGHGRRLDALGAALVNCQSSSAHAFDDTHLATVVHPSGPVAAAILALAEGRTVSGPDFLLALALGIEVACRLAAALVVPPAEAQLGWYMTGVTCGVGAAAGAARLLCLPPRQTGWALGIAAAQSSGFRQTHATMCTSLIPGHAARAGLWAALLAEQDVTCSDHVFEGPRGFADVFAPKAHLSAATDGLGEHWEMLANVYKPYPCGIVIHPAIDGCLEIAAEPGFEATAIDEVDLGVHPLCLVLCDRPAPADGQVAQVSLQHWTAAALVRAAAGIPEGSDDCVADPAVQAVRARVRAKLDPSVGRDGAVIRIKMRDGKLHERRIEHAIGSLERPMSDAELEAKFMAQALPILSEAKARALSVLCRRLPELDDAAAIARAACP